jgi:signal peptidase I
MSDVALQPVDANTPLAEPQPQINVRRPRPNQLLLAVQWLAGGIVVALFVVTFLVQAFQIPSESMENTLLVGDYLLVDKVHYGRGGIWGHVLPYEPLRRGDIVVFRYPVHPELHFVKRVIAVPGDHVRLVDKTVYVNDRPVEEKYAVHSSRDFDRYRDDFPQNLFAPDMDAHWWVQLHQFVHNGELEVPPDSYFVLGDNREHSLDSRYWGFVPRENVIGRPLVIYWSMDRDPTGSGSSGSDRLSRLADAVYYVLHLPRWHRAFHVVK